MTDLALAGVAYAEASCGQWIARCPRPWCTNALLVERGQPEFACNGGLACGATAPLSWPADPDAIEAILLLRPVPTTRNWLPGETLQQLLEENAVHDCIPSEWLELAQAQPGGGLDLLVTADERVVGGILHQQLEAAGRREIGA